MLEGLDGTNWRQLGHAYGTAEDVPDLIRALASDDEALRKKARSQLWGNIIHQGTVYSATSYAIPFLLELLESPHVEEKCQLLVYVAALACGTSFHEVHQPLFERMGVYRLEINKPDWHRRIQEELGWVQAARLAVAAGTPTYLQLLDDSDPTIRHCAAYTLGVAGAHGTEVIPRLLSHLTVEQDDRVTASILLSLGCLRGPESGPLFERYLETASSAVVRTAAALSFVRNARAGLPQTAIQHLCNVMQHPEPIDELYCQLPWSRGESVVAAASAALSGLGHETAERTVPSMLDALERRRQQDPASISVVGSILSLVFEARKEPRKPTALSAFQRQIVHRLARCDRTWDWSNVSQILRQFGLPHCRETLAAFAKLGEPAAAEDDPCEGVLLSAVPCWRESVPSEPKGTNEERFGLTIDGEGPVDAPTPEQVSAAVARMAGGGPKFIILEGPGEEFAQAARHLNGITAEWRELLAQGFCLWKAGRSGSSAAVKATVPDNAPAFVERPNELLGAPEVTAILLAFLRCQGRPQQFTWRDITGTFY